MGELRMNVTDFGGARQERKRTDKGVKDAVYRLELWRGEGLGAELGIWRGSKEGKEAPRMFEARTRALNYEAGGSFVRRSWNAGLNGSKAKRWPAVVRTSEGR